jgi:hypothetical protein
VVAQVGGQGTLADAAHAHERHHAAALLHDPLGQFGHFHLAAREGAHVEGFHQVDPPGGGLLRCRLGGGRAVWWGKLDGCSRSEQVMEPGLIQQHLLVCRTPQRADFLFLAPGGKGGGSHPQGDELFEAFGLGIAEASLPLRHRAPGDAEGLGQPRLRQADGGAQRQHQLTKGIVSLTVHMSLHERSPFCVTWRSKDNRK